jgi:hypothetical protein
MSEYFFFIRTDKNKESINKGKFASKSIAKTTFARHKKLSLEEFNKLFKVEEYDKRRP